MAEILPSNKTPVKSTFEELKLASKKRISLQTNPLKTPKKPLKPQVNYQETQISTKMASNTNSIQLWCDIHHTTTHSTKTCHLNKMRVKPTQMENKSNTVQKWCDIHDTNNHSTKTCYSNKLRVPNKTKQNKMNEENTKKQLWCDIHDTTAHSTKTCYSNNKRIKQPDENKPKCDVSSKNSKN